MSDWSDALLSLDPTSCWLFNGDFTDEMGVADGTGVGSPTFTSSLVPSERNAPNSALLLDGTGQRVECGDVYDFASSEFTILGLWRADNSDYQANFRRLIQKRDSTAPNAGWLFYGSPVNLIGQEWDLGATGESVSWNSDLDTLTTHMVVMRYIYSTKEMSVWEDGVEQGWTTTAFTADPHPTTTGPLVIGGNFNNANGWLGAIDDVAIWDSTALIDADIEALWDIAIRPLQTKFVSRRILVRR